MQICYDERGNKYDLPMFVINEPESYPEKVKTAVIENGDKKITVKLQYLATLKEVQFRLDTPIPIIRKAAIDIVKASDGFDDTKDAIRLLYQGKIFKEDSKLGAYLKGDALVQVFKVLKQ